MNSTKDIDNAIAFEITNIVMFCECSGFSKDEITNIVFGIKETPEAVRDLLQFCLSCLANESPYASYDHKYISPYEEEKVDESKITQSGVELKKNKKKRNNKKKEITPIVS